MAQDLTAARAAIDAVEQACSSLTRHLGAPPKRVHDPDVASFYVDGYNQLMDSAGRRVR